MHLARSHLFQMTGLSNIYKLPFMQGCATSDLKHREWQCIPFKRLVPDIKTFLRVQHFLS